MPDRCIVHGGHRVPDAPGRCNRYDYVRRCEFTRVREVHAFPQGGGQFGVAWCGTKPLKLWMGSGTVPADLGKVTCPDCEARLTRMLEET